MEDLGILNQSLMPAIWYPEILSGDWPRPWQGTPALGFESSAWQGICWMTEVCLSLGKSQGLVLEKVGPTKFVPIPQEWLHSAGT